MVDKADVVVVGDVSLCAIRRRRFLLSRSHIPQVQHLLSVVLHRFLHLQEVRVQSSYHGRCDVDVQQRLRIHLDIQPHAVVAVVDALVQARVHLPRFNGYQPLSGASVEILSEESDPGENIQRFLLQVERERGVLQLHRRHWDQRLVAVGSEDEADGGDGAL